MNPLAPSTRRIAVALIVCAAHFARADDLDAPGFASIAESPLEFPTDALPPLDVELYHHGGSYLYEPLDINSKLYRPPARHHPPLRLPEDWQEPQPLALPYDFLGSHFIEWRPGWEWCGSPGYQWEPRLVGYGSYQIFGALFEESGERRDGIGHQLILDLDLALTGTERAHVQFRPFGEENSGGSFFVFSSPSGYVNNHTAVPQRWWIEGELQSIFGRMIGDPTVQLDINFTAGKFPFALHNFLLINDEITGIVLGKNTITHTPLSNLNVQLFYAADEVDAFNGRNSDFTGIHLQGDYRLAFLEFTYAHVFPGGRPGRDADFFAFSGTQFFGPLSLAGRTMFKIGDEAGRGDGQLYVLESNFTRKPSHEFEDATGIELAVAYLNVFKATSGWQSIAGGNFDRLRNLFTLNPLLQIAAGRPPVDTTGAALGVQLFRHNEDESIIPEVAIEEVDSDTVWGLGLRYQRQLTPRCYLDLRGLKTWSDYRPLVREGLFASTIIIF